MQTEFRSREFGHSKYTDYYCARLLQSTWSIQACYNTIQAFICTNWVLRVRFNFCFKWRLFVGHVEKANATQCTDEEYNVKPTMIEVEFQITKNFCNDWSVTKFRAKWLNYKEHTRYFLGFFCPNYLSPLIALSC